MGGDVHFYYLPDDFLDYQTITLFRPSFFALYNALSAASISLLESILSLGTMDAVSYTHLDVYKRQEKDFGYSWTKPKYVRY